MLMRVGLGLLMAAAVTGLAQGPTTPAPLPALRGGAMLDCSGLPCVDVTVASGKHLKLLLDMGDVQSVLDTAVAKELGLAVAAVRGRDGKEIPGYGQATLAGLAVGDASLGDVKMLVMDLSAMEKKDQMPKADGSLTYTAFKDRLLEMDYVDKRVRFSEVLTAGVACPEVDKCGVISLPTFGKAGPPIVVATGFSINGKPITAQIDTLYSGTMLIYPTSVEKLGLTQEAKTTKTRMFKYTDGGVDMGEAPSAEEGFAGRVLAKGPVYFATPAVHVPDGMFDGTVGQELFEESVLVMDFKGMRVWMRG
jgi:hypothetical protein